MNQAVDERIVEMQFDNEDFERDVSKTMGTLDKLKNSLSFTNVKDGFDKIQNGIMGTNFGPIEEALYRVQDGFGMVEMLGLQAMSRISNAALDMGQSLINAVTIDPIKSGLQEYETQIGAIQTIMANTEEAFKDVSEQEHLDKVNDALDELNHYADKTIYNFTEMTRNIGTFTAAGVSLDESKTAIQGIANMAAVSGSTSQQASNAMYQLSQALASGSVKLQDWNSVVSAGMGGEVFKNALKESSKAMVVANEKVQTLAASGKKAEEISKETGISLDRVSKLMENGYANSYDTAIAKHGKFRDSLTDGWITSEVLIDALRNATLNLDEMTESEQESTKAMLKANGYTDEQIDGIFRLGKSATEAATKVKTFTQLIDTTKEALQSGWTQSWEYIIGDFGEAKNLWTGISDYLGTAINKSADARNKILEQWHDKGGRDTIIDGLKEGFQGLTKYASIFKSTVVDNIIPDVTAKNLIDFSNTIKNIGHRINPSLKELISFRNILKSFTQPIEVVKDFFKSFIEPYQETFVNTLKNTGKILGEVIERVGMFIDFISGMLRVAHIPGRLAEAITSAFGKLGDIFIDVYGKFKEFLSALTGVKFDFFDPKNGNWAKAGQDLGAMIDKISGKISSVKTRIGEFATTMSTAIKDVTGFDLQKFFTWDNFIAGVTKFREKLVSLPETFNTFKTSAQEGFNGFISSFNEFTGLNLHMPTWDEFKATLQSVVDTVKQWKVNFDTTSTAIANFFILIWDKLEPVRDGFNDAKTAVQDFFASFKKDKGSEEGLNILDKLSAAANTISTIFGQVFDKISNGIGVLWEKIKDFESKINLKDVVAGLLGGAGGLGLLNIATFFGNLNKTIRGDAVFDFFKEIEKMFDNFTDKLKDAADTFKDIMEPFGDTLAAFQNKLKADMLKNIALAVAILVGSLIAISLVEPNKLLTGIIAIGVLFEELLAASKGLTMLINDDDTKKFASLTLALIKFAGALVIMSSAVVALGALKPEQLLGGLVGVGALVLMLLGFVNQFNKMEDFDVKGFSKLAGALIPFAIAMRLLSSSVVKLGGLNFGALAKGLLGVAVLLGSLGLFTKFADADNMGIRSGIGILLLATAIGMLSKVVLSLGEMDINKMGNGLGGIAILLGSLGLFTKFSDVENVGIRSGLGLMAIAQAIRMLADGVMLFVDLNMDQINNGLYAIAMILGTLGLFTKFSDVNNMGLMSGVGIILLAQGVKMLADVAKEFVDMNPEQLIKGLGSLGAILAMLSLTATLMQGTASAGASMILMALALNMLVIPLTAFGAMEWESIAKGMAVLGGVFLILGVAGTVLAPVAVVILGLAGALMMIGAAAALAGVGMLSMAAGLNILQNFANILNTINMEMMLHLLQEILGFIAGLIPGFVGLISNIIGAIVIAIAQNATTIIQAVVSVGLALLEAIKTLIPALIDTGVLLLKSLLKGINDNIFELVLLGASILVNFMNGLALAAPTLIEAGVNLIISLIDGMAGAIINNADRLVNAMNNVFWSIIYALLALVQGAVEKIPGIGGMISDKIEGIKDNIKEKVNFEEGKSVTNDLMNGVETGVEEGSGGVTDKVNNLADAVNKGLATIDGKGLGESISEGVVSGVESSEGDASNAANFLMVGVNDTLTATPITAGSDLVEKLKSGMTTGGPSLNTVATSLGDGALKAFKGTDGESSGSDLVDKIAKGMTGNQSAVEGAAEDVGEAGAGSSGFGASFDDFENSGEHIMNGAAQGISGNSGAVESAAYNAGLKALNAFNSATGVSSPSWKFAESGMYQMIGGAQGITNNMGLLIGAAKYAGEETVDAFSESIADLSDAADLGIDDAPSIRPVMDLSGIQNGVSRINSILSRDMANSVSVNMPKRVDVGAAIGDFSSIQNQGNTDMLDVLRAQMAQTERLIYLLENQHIYLDGNTMVGKMVGRIDNALGQRAMLAGRRRG